MQFNFDSLKLNGAAIDRVKSLFKPKAVTLTGDRIYAACVCQSRLPVLYTDYGVEDAIGARFEVLTFHVALVIYVLKSLSAEDARREQASDTAQALFDAFLLALDNTLREQGTGDLSVAKKMKPLGQAIYTRMKRWDEMWTQGAPRSDRADYIARTLFAGTGYGSEDEVGISADDPLSPQVLSNAEAFTDYAEAARNALSVDAILTGLIAWPEPAPLADTSAAI